MQQTVPAYLVSTYQLLQCAFPQGIAEQEYLPLLGILYEQMSDRSLAQVMAEFTGKDYSIVLNDIYRVGSIALSTEVRATLSSIQQKLMHCNYEQWLTEEFQP
jgi:hypothetical protein